MSGVTLPISVVICTVDRPEALQRCIRGLLGGDQPPAQVVVVDQGASTAPSARDAKIDYLRASDEGVSRARNLGAAAASHDVLAFTDDDCLPSPRWLHAVTRAYDDGVDGVTGPVLPLPGADGVAVSSRTSVIRRTFRGHGFAPWDIGTGGNLSLRRTVFDRVGGFDETLGPGTTGRAAEDIDLLYRVVTADCALIYEPDAVVYHELKTRRTRLNGRFDYGFGLGTFLGRHAAAGDEHARALRRRYARQLGRRAASAARHGDGWPTVEAGLTLAGIIAGSVAAGRR